MLKVRDAISKILAKYSENIAELGFFLSGCAVLLGLFGDGIWFLAALTIIIITSVLYFSSQRGV